MAKLEDRLWTKPFIIATFSGFLLFLNLQMQISSIPVYLKDHFQAGDFKIGLVTGLFAVSAIVSRVLAGRPSMKARTVFLLLLGVSVTLLATAGSYWCTAYWQYLAARILNGFGFGIASTMLPTMASNLIPLKRMGEGMGYFGFSNTLGLSLGPVFGMFLLLQYGYGMLTFTASLVLLLIFPLILGVFRKRLQEKETVHSGVKGGKSSNRFPKKLLLPFFLNLLLSITYSGLIGFIALFGVEKNIQSATVFFLVQSAAVLFIRPFAGKLFDRKGPASTLVPGGILIMAGLIVLSYSGGTALLSLSAVVYGCGYGIIQPSIQAWMIKEVAAEERGLANGMFFNSIDLGVALGSALLGMVAAGVGYAMMYRLSALFMVLFILITVISVRQKRASKVEADASC